MNCDNPLIFMGASVNFMGQISENSINEEWVIYLRASERIFCAFSLISITSILIIKCFSRRMKSYVDSLKKSSIFSFLDDLPRQSDIEEFREFMVELEKLTPSQFKKKIPILDTTSLPSFDFEEKDARDNMAHLLKDKTTPCQEVYICDCNDCFINCCCKFWLETVHKKYISPSLSAAKRTFETFYYQNLTEISFYCSTLVPFVFVSLREIFSVAFNECALEKMDVFLQQFFYVIFFFVDLFCGSLYIALFIFVISFLNTRKELLRIYHFHKSFRAKLVYYHLNKSLKFGVLYFLLKLFFKAALVFEFACYDMMESDYSIVWIIFKTLFLLFSIKFSNSLSHSSIEGDCLYQLAHAKYFAVQSILLNQIPNAKTVYETIKRKILKLKNKRVFTDHSINDEDQFFISLTNKEKLDLKFLKNKFANWCERAKNDLIADIQIIEGQKFNNILRNNGYLRYIPSVFLLIFILNSILALINGIALLIKSKYNYQPIKDVNFLFFATIITFIDTCVFPILIFFCLKKSTIKKKI